MIVRDTYSACGCITRTITYSATELNPSRAGSPVDNRDRSSIRGGNEFRMQVAVCIAQHLRQEQAKESYFGKLYNQHPDTVTAIASRLFMEKLELETTH